MDFHFFFFTTCFYVKHWKYMCAVDSGIKSFKLLECTYMIFFFILYSNIRICLTCLIWSSISSIRFLSSSLSSTSLSLITRKIKDLIYQPMLTNFQSIIFKWIHRVWINSKWNFFLYMFVVESFLEFYFIFFRKLKFFLDSNDYNFFL